MKHKALRARALLKRWFEVTLVASLVVAAAGGWVAYEAHFAPDTHEEQRTVDEWSVEGSFAHRATVNQAAGGTPFEPGSVVRNRTAYFHRVMPVLNGQFFFGVRNAGAPVDVRVRQQLVVRSVAAERGANEPTVYWQQNRTLGESETTVQSGRRATVPFSLNVTETVREAQNVNAQLGSPGRIQTQVVVTAVVTRQIDDAESETLTFTLPIQSETSIYRVQSEPQQQTFSQTRVVTVSDDVSPVQRIGGPVLFITGLLGVVGLVVVRSRGAISFSEAERDWLTYRDDRMKFAEWITTVRLPDEAATLPVARADTLGDLVDFAIDTDSAVLESPDGDAYHVIHGAYRYTFEAPPKPERLAVTLSSQKQVDGAQSSEDRNGEDSESSVAND